MEQPNSGQNAESPAFHGHGKSTHEANMKEHQVQQDTGDNPNRRGTNGNFGDTLQLSLHQYHQPQTKDSKQPHQLVTIHIQPGK